MKKLLLIPALMLGTASMAEQFDYELTPLIGYNISEGNLGFKDQYMVGGELQYNGFNSAIKPELSYIYSNPTQTPASITTQADVDVHKLALNGVYEFGDNGDAIIPLIKAGLGYEFIPDTAINKNESGTFANLGLGAKIPLMDSGRLALKLEALYEAKYNDLRNSNFDSNLALLAGITLAFGGDDLRPGNADNSAEIAAANAAALAAQEDADKARREAAAAAALAATSVAGTLALTEANADDDNDGVKNTLDKCPNTPEGFTVANNGCMIKMNLHINFENASSKIDNASQKNAKLFTQLLKASPAYNVEIHGHTDSVGSAAFNQNLSQKRADSVKTMLVNKGIESKRITAIGKGENHPVASNKTAAGRAENRRIEAQLTKSK